MLPHGLLVPRKRSRSLSAFSKHPEFRSRETTSGQGRGRPGQIRHGQIRPGQIRLGGTSPCQVTVHREVTNQPDVGEAADAERE